MEKRVKKGLLQDKQLLSSLLISGLAVALLWIIHVGADLLSLNLTGGGILPRKAEGLFGILTAPFIHGSYEHLLSNSAPGFVLLAAILYFYRPLALQVVIWTWFMTGLWVWIAANSAYHIGASGVIYGFAGYLFFSGLFRRETYATAIAMLMVFLYGGMLWGVFPGQEGISWESHLFGGIAGLVLAWFFRRRYRQARRKYSWENEPEEVRGDDQAYWNYRPQYYTAVDEEIEEQNSLK